MIVIFILVSPLFMTCTLISLNQFQNTILLNEIVTSLFNGDDFFDYMNA